MTLDCVMDDFRIARDEGFPVKLINKAAGIYLETIMEYERDDMIGDDTFLDALAEIRDYLKR